MKNLECAVAVLAAHREARQWSDEMVAADLLRQLGLKEDEDAKNAIVAPEPSIHEIDVAAAETAAKEMIEKAVAIRHAFNQQAEAEAKAKETSLTQQAAAEKARRDAELARLQLQRPIVPVPPASLPIWTEPPEDIPNVLPPHE